MFDLDTIWLAEVAEVRYISIKRNNLEVGTKLGDYSVNMYSDLGLLTQKIELLLELSAFQQ